MKKLLPVVIVVAGFTIFFFISCSLMVKEEVTYIVDSNTTDTANITYTDDNGNAQSLIDESLPWTKKVKITYGEDQELEEVSLTATTSDSATVNVTATITWSK